MIQRFMNADTSTRLDVVGLLLTGFINTFLAMFDAGVILAEGMPTIQPDSIERMQWIADNKTVWQAGWLFWFAVTLSFSWSYYALGRHLKGAKSWINLAIGLAIIAAAVDIVGVLVNLVVLPELADSYVQSQDPILMTVFETQQLFSTALTNVAAFGLYSLAGLLLLPACISTPTYPRQLVWLGIAEWGIATFATILLIFGTTLATGPLLISFVLYAPWVWASAWWILTQAES